MTWADLAQTPPRGAAAAAATAPESAPPTVSVSEAPGRSLGVTLGVYRLVQRLGEGGMGVVHLGLDPHGRAVAIKVLRAHIAHDPEARARLNREVATLSRVRHPLVAEVLDADVDGDQPYVVTRYVPGPTLDAEVRDRGPMPPEHLVQLGRGLLSALEAIHAAGVIHRDLKPGNVLMLDGDPIVIDFGIAHVADDARLTSTGLVMGTPGYLSPELVDGSVVTAATDWWGWAATLAFAASGQAPYGRGPAGVVIDRVRRGEADLSGVDGRLRPLLSAALSPDPARRPGAAEVLAALERFARGREATVAVPIDLRGAPTVAAPTAAAPTVAAPAAGPTATRALPASPAPMGVLPSATTDDPFDSWLGPEPGYDAASPVKPRRTGTVLAVFVGLVGLASSWPALTALVAAGGLVAARAADRTVAAQLRRREERGASRADPFLAVITAPWHLLAAALAGVIALIVPAVLGLGAAFGVSLVSGAVSRSATGVNAIDITQLAAAVGLAVALLVAWSGRAGAPVRRGSRALARGVVRPGAATAVVVTVVLVGGAAAALAGYSRGHPIYWPWP